jgi:F-type H+-transporting ATPase subunit a
MMIAESELDHIGSHPTWHYGSMVFNSDTIIATLVSAAVVLLLAFLVRAKVSAESPGKLQLAFETLMSWVNETVEANLGRLHPFVVPLAFALFIFILIANWVHFLPTEHFLVPANADTNLTYAMAFIVIIGVHIFAVKHHGIREYLKGYLKPYPVMAPLTILEELIKPFTLALRLFGNIFAGGIMLALIGQMPFYVQWLPSLIWQLFDMFIGLIQAFIFALLTILYFGMAASGHGGDEGHDGDATHDATDDQSHSTEDVPQAALQPA